MRLFSLSIFVVLHVCSAPSFAQQADTLDARLPEVVIEATREAETAATAPFAVSLIAREPAEVALEPALTLEAALRDMPGIWINDRENMALGERITVRGMGWRAPWGVRGVQLVLDGIPLTLPDGQSFPGIIPPSLIRRAELVRGPASHFWGNGSGGVLFLSTSPMDEASFTRLRALTGSYGERELLAEGGGSVGDAYARAYVSNTRQGEYRRHSQGTRTRAGVHGTYDAGERTSLRLMTAFEHKDALHPSSLTREQLESDPRMARPLFVEQQAGEESTQGQAGLSIERETPNGRILASGYGLVRTLQNPLPFAYIAYDRTAGGARVAWQAQVGRIEGGVSADVGMQRDDRQNFNTVDGRRGDTVQLDQLELVSESGVSAFAGLGISTRIRATAALRASRLRFEADDRLLRSEDPALAGDQSGSRTFTALSPSVGLSYRAGGSLLFAGYSTAFETPTMTEIVNRPVPTGGFNENIEPQTTRGIEAGVRGGWTAVNLQFDVVLFRLNVDNALVQTGTNEAGREFFGNAAASIHQGVEASATWTPAGGTTLRMSYTGGTYVYDGDITTPDGTRAVDGNSLPGIPDHRLRAQLRQTRNGLWMQAGVRAVSDYHVDDANTTADRTDGYVVADLLLGHAGLQAGSLLIRPFAEVGNVFDTAYVGSVVVNAFGGRYYEPAPGRAISVGLEARF